jgi:hypothetical protein
MAKNKARPTSILKIVRKIPSITAFNSTMLDAPTVVGYSGT